MELLGGSILDSSTDIPIKVYIILSLEMLSIYSKGALAYNLDDYYTDGEQQGIAG